MKQALVNWSLRSSMLYLCFAVSGLFWVTSIWSKMNGRWGPFSLQVQRIPWMSLLVLISSAGVPFFQIVTSNICPALRCFVHFDLKMRFAPQWRAIFPDRNLKNWSPGMWCLCILTWKCASCHSGVPFFQIGTWKIGRRECGACAFWLENALRATAACHFCRRELEKLVGECGVLCILTCKCASRHSGVPFFISLLNSYLRTRRFSEPTFRTSGTTNPFQKTQRFATFLTFGACVSPL